MKTESVTYYETAVVAFEAIAVTDEEGEVTVYVDRDTIDYSDSHVLESFAHDVNRLGVDFDDTEHIDDMPYGLFEAHIKGETTS